MKHAMDDHMVHQHLLQRVSVVVQRGNTSAVLEDMGGGVEVRLL